MPPSSHNPPPARERDRALVDACIAGSKDAWERIVRDHHDPVRFAIIRTLHTHGQRAPDHLVEDLEAALFLKLANRDFRRLRQFRGNATLKSWLKVLATNATVDHLRKRKKTEPIGPGEPLELTDPAPRTDVALERAELLERLRAALAELPEADAQFVELFFVQERSFDEIAEEMGTTTAALYTRKNRIRKRMLALAEREDWLGRSSG